ncbi:MAG: FkbM family methyltransferase [Flavipsychrobacter sp.]|jgi:FkbM family methyltransferase|nr:FkbM family methyltransferase [Flavipsychrobacter sp.]
MSLRSVVKSISRTFNFVTDHPLNRDNKLTAILRFVKWQVMLRLASKPIIHSFTDKARIIIKKGMYGATGNVYCGLYEFYDMGFLLHFLRKEDLFIDVGANIGSYTALAVGHVRAKTISFEPGPVAFEQLKKNIEANKAQDIATPLQMAVGEKKGVVQFTTNLDSMNHVAVSTDKQTIQVNLDSLDNILADKYPALMKIDVEGLETEVIKGAAKTLAKKELKAIIIELNSGGKKYGYNKEAVHEMLSAAGFEPYLYNPLKRTLTHAGTFGYYNTIYVRDLPFVENRLKTAEPFKVLNKII